MKFDFWFILLTECHAKNSDSSAIWINNGSPVLYSDLNKNVLRTTTLWMYHAERMYCETYDVKHVL